MSEPWIDTLRTACERSSQVHVSRMLRDQDGFPSPATINQVLHGKYPSERGMTRLQLLVEERLQSEGEVPTLVNTPPWPIKLTAAAHCIADLKLRGLDSLVDGIEVSRLLSRPIIRLKRSPPQPLGEQVVQVSRFPKGGLRVLCIKHLGCELRWRVPA